MRDESSSGSWYQFHSLVLLWFSGSLLQACSGQYSAVFLLGSLFQHPEDIPDVMQAVFKRACVKAPSTFFETVFCV
jgi:hypothetical protein